MTDQEKLAKAIDALSDIAMMTDGEDPGSYRADDREACLNTVLWKAKQTLSEITT